MGAFLKLSTAKVEITVERHIAGYYGIYRLNLVSRLMEQIGCETNLKRAKKLAVELMRREIVVKEAV